MALNLRIAVLSLCIWLPSLAAQAEEVVQVKDAFQKVDLGLFLEIAEDTKGTITFDDLKRSEFKALKFEPNRQDTPSFGFTHSAYWARFVLVNLSEKPVRLILEQGYPLLDRMDIYESSPTGKWHHRRGGDIYPFHFREVSFNHVVFRIFLERGEKRMIYMRFSTTSSMQFPLTLWSNEAFLNAKVTLYFVYGALFGLIFVMVLYNLFLFLPTRDLSFIYYCFCMLGAVLFIGSISGHTFQYLWPAFPAWFNRSIPICMGVWGIGSVVFSRRFLHSRNRTPKFDVLLKLILGGFILVVVFGFFADVQIVTRLSSINCVIGCISFQVIGIRIWRNGFPPARFYVLAWIFFCSGVVLFALKSLGVTPSNVITHFGLHVGISLAAVLMSMALGDQINIMREEKERAQAQALALQQQTTETLAQEVNKQTLALQKRTEEAEQAKEALERAYQRLSEHDRLKSNFFANVSHELRTPLTLILTPLERLIADEEKDVSPKVKEKLLTMDGNTQRLLRLVNQLLDFSRIESGGAEINYELRDIFALLEPIYEGFLAFARSKGLKFELRGDHNLPSVYVDPNMLDKVICNLLSNACKFTEPGGTVIVRLSQIKNYITITVRDTGIGIPEENLEHIFERFRQVDSGSSRRYEGTGIGLALAKELVELMGGKIEVKSEVAIGSTFTVYLCLGRDHIRADAKILTDAAVAKSQSMVEADVAALTAELGSKTLGQSKTSKRVEDDERRPAPASETSDVKKPTLLIVEDNPQMRALVRDICKNDFEVIEAKDGPEGLVLLQEHHPNLIISDVMMPGIDGYELLRRVRADRETATIPMMLLTAKAGPATRIEGLELGADDYLIKPFKTRELLARAKNLVRLKEQEHELLQLNTKLQELVMEKTKALERFKQLQRYLPPEVAQQILDNDQPVDVVHQRLRLTVFRIELRGFEILLESNDPEEIVALLNSYLNTIMEVAFTHGATVDRLLSESVVGFFGAPLSQNAEQDALKCAQMAIDLFARTNELCHGWEAFISAARPQPTIVVSTGFATVGNFGSSKRLEYSAVGGPIDETKALLPLVQAGAVYCSQSTYGLIQNKYPRDPEIEIKLANRSQGIRMYLLTAPPQPNQPENSRELIQPPAGAGGSMSLAQTREPVLSHLSQGSASPTSLPVSNIDELQPDSVFAERYQVVSQLGRGGMSIVYHVNDLKLGIPVVLKLVRRDVQLSEVLKHFYREVKMARLIYHPNVARLYDLSEWESYEFISMEYIQGRTLQMLLAEKGPFPTAEAVHILQQVCAGLAAAHVAGVVHLDLKPSNIIVEDTGRAVILDFGISRWMHSRKESNAITKQVRGTPHYMAPEQFEECELNHRTDIYSLGVVAYEMLTGQMPFTSDNIVSLGYQHAFEPPKNPIELRPDLPAKIAALIMRCLSKKPWDRFDSVEEIISLLI